MLILETYVALTFTKPNPLTILKQVYLEIIYRQDTHNPWLIDATECLFWEFSIITDIYLIPVL